MHVSLDDQGTSWGEDPNKDGNSGDAFACGVIALDTQVYMPYPNTAANTRNQCSYVLMMMAMYMWIMQ